MTGSDKRIYKFYRFIESQKFRDEKRQCECELKSFSSYFCRKNWMLGELDIILIPVAYCYVFGIIYLASQLKSQNIIDGKMARKVVHLGIGILVIAAPLLFSSNTVPVAIGISFIVITFFTSPISPIHKWRLSAFRDGHGLGTVYYSFSLTALLFLFFDEGWIIQIGFLPLVFGDAFANIIGLKYGEHKWPGTEKSVEGSLGGLIASLFVLLISLSIYYFLNEYPGSYPTIILISLIVSSIMAIVELISPYGFDNLTIPISCTFTALLFQSQIFKICGELICHIV